MTFRLKFAHKAVIGVGINARPRTRAAERQHWSARAAVGQCEAASANVL